MSNIPAVEGGSASFTPRPVPRPMEHALPIQSPAPEGEDMVFFKLDATSAEDIKQNNYAINWNLTSLLNKTDQHDQYLDNLVNELKVEFSKHVSKASMEVFYTSVVEENSKLNREILDLRSTVEGQSLMIADLNDTITRFQLAYPLRDDLYHESGAAPEAPTPDTFESAGDSPAIPQSPKTTRPKVTFEEKNPYDALPIEESDSDSSLDSAPRTSVMPSGLLTSSDDEFSVPKRKVKDLPFSAIKPPALPAFDGQRDPLTWFTEVENILDSLGGSELNYHRAISKVVLGFKGDAAMWWRDYKQGHPVKSLTWKRFKKALCSYFKTLDREDAAMIKLFSLQQKGSIQQYVTYIKKLLLVLPDTSDKDLYIRFKFGLKESIRNELLREEARRRTNFIPLKDAFKFCSMIERAETRTELLNKALRASTDATRSFKNSSRESSGTHGGGGGHGSSSHHSGHGASTSGTGGKNGDSSSKSGLEKVICNKCKRPGHYSKNCESKWTKDSQPICSLCKKVGHRTKDCPTSTDKGKGPAK